MVRVSTGEDAVDAVDLFGQNTKAKD